MRGFVGYLARINLFYGRAMVVAGAKEEGGRGRGRGRKGSASGQRTGGLERREGEGRLLGRRGKRRAEGEGGVSGKWWAIAQ